MSNAMDLAGNPEVDFGATHSRERPLNRREQMKLGRLAAYLVRATNEHLFIVRRVAGLLCALALFSSLTACSENKIPVEVMGYNHISDESIMGFSVNGAGGPNLAPESGGGGRNCCIAIPERWHPRMKARVTWAYGHGPAGSRPSPPPQEAEVEIPEYTPQNLGSVQVHFYPGHRIKVVVSKFGIESPCGPLTEIEKTPWVTRADLTEYYTTGKGKNEQCDGLSRKS